MRTAYFLGFELRMKFEHAEACAHSGPCDEDVEQVLKQGYIREQLERIGADKIRDELREYGAWDDNALADDDTNRARIVWIATGNIQEEDI